MLQANGQLVLPSLHKQLEDIRRRQRFARQAGTTCTRILLQANAINDNGCLASVCQSRQRLLAAEGISLASHHFNRLPPRASQQQVPVGSRVNNAGLIVGRTT
jgi:hypothetical protein